MCDLIFSGTVLYLISLYLLNYQFLRTEGLFWISSKRKVSLCLGVLAGEACSDWHSVSSVEKHNERNISAQQYLSFDSVQKPSDETVLPTWQVSHFTSIKPTKAFIGMTRVCFLSDYRTGQDDNLNVHSHYNQCVSKSYSKHFRWIISFLIIYCIDVVQFALKEKIISTAHMCMGWLYIFKTDLTACSKQT